MTTEDDFHRALDADPADWQTRLVFADWLEERADPRAEGYRALGLLRKFPMLDLRHTWNANQHRWNKRRVKVWVWMQTITGRGTPAQLKECWARLVPDRKFATRREADDAAALAFGQLPAARRAELLTAAEVPA